MRYINWKKVTNQVNEHRYIDALQNIVDDYNRTPHSTIKMAPQNVTTRNSAQLYEKMRKRWTNIEPVTPKLREGNLVRVKRKKNTFQKESMTPLWTDEIFKISRVIERVPYPVYEIEDLKGRAVDGRLYERELQKIRVPPDTPIEIVKKPNVFDRMVTTKTLEGKTKTFDLQKEKKARRENNYADVIPLLL